MTINITTVDFQFMETNLLQALKWKEKEYGLGSGYN